jgi:hypothetical protein
MTNGGIALLISLLQVVFAALLGNELPRWAFVASLGLFLREGAQMFSARISVFQINYQ